MPDCQFLKKCQFFKGKLAKMPTTSQIMKEIYCTGDASSCARFIVLKAIGKENVPADLYPSSAEKAKEIIKRNQRQAEL